MLVNLNAVLSRARKKRYAVGAFNTSNLEITQAILSAAQDLRSPVIVAVSEKAIAYAGLAEICSIVAGRAKKMRIPVVLHLDHGLTYELAAACIGAGFTSVMIDASAKSFAENVNLTRRVKTLARRHGVSVEAELGRLAGIEDDRSLTAAEARYTDPDQARRFVRESECDALAVAIGTSHGAYKFKGRPRLRIDILRAIRRAVGVPLVLHGASAVKRRWVDYVNRYGGELGPARGVPDRLLKEAIQNGVTKINVDTDLRIAFTAGVREQLGKDPRDFDPRKLVGAGREQVYRSVRERMMVFGSKNRIGLD